MKSCQIDPTHKTYSRKDRNGYEDWYKYKEGYICKNCYMKLFQHSKWNPIHNPKRTKEQIDKFNKRNGPRRIVYKSKSVFLKEKPRTGYCSKCTNNIYDGSCKRTNLHHIKYHDDDPLKDTIELCHSCHRKEHKQIKISLSTNNIQQNEEVS